MWCLICDVEVKGNPGETIRWIEAARPCYRVGLDLSGVVCTEHLEEVIGACQQSMDGPDERLMLISWIARQVRTLNKPALVWLLQRTAVTLQSLYPPESAAKAVRSHVEQVL